MNPHVRPRPKVDYRVPWAHGVKLGVLPESLRRGSLPGVVVAGGPRGSGTHGCWETALPLPTARVSHAGGGLALAVAAGSGSAKPATKQGSRLGRGRSPRSGPQGGPARLLLLWAVGPGWWLMALPLSNCATSDGSVTSLKS